VADLEGNAATGRVPVVVVAPDSFKGTFTAGEVADELAGGLRAGGIERIRRCPVADGGEGTLDALIGRVDGELHGASVRDPLGREIEAVFGVSGDRRTAVIEIARAVGLGLLGGGERDAEAASTAGVGDLIVAARDAGAVEIVVGLGGSATTDGGAGAIEVIVGSGGLRGARLVLLCDVRTPFEQAAVVFGPQKGADAESVIRLTDRLERVARGLPRDPRGVAMTGAAGGLAGGLWAAFDGRLVGGAGFVLDRLEFDGLLAEASGVVTGEGRLDGQTVAGKAVAEIAGRGRRAGIPIHAVVGCDALGREASGALGLSSVREAGTREGLRAAGAALARQLLAG
jgi:glycerate kinase